MANYTGTAGNETLLGSSGNDLFTPNGGTDSIFGGTGDDTVQLTGLLADYTIAWSSSTRRYTLTSAAQTVVVGGVEFFQFGDGLRDWSNLLAGAGDGLSRAGTAGDDVLAGSVGYDRLSGLDGNDALDGGMSNDTLSGGGGNDTIVGGAGDTLSRRRRKNRATSPASRKYTTPEIRPPITSGTAGSNTVSRRQTFVQFAWRD